MGLANSSLKNYLFPRTEKHILLYGLEAVGKTAVLKKMQLDQETYPMPIPDYCEGMVDLERIRFYILDIARRLTARMPDNYFFDKCDAIILVVDSADCDSFNEVNEILDDMMLSEQLKETIFIIFANKQDLPNALNPKQVSEKINSSERNRICQVQGTSGLTGDGVREGLQYLQGCFLENKWFNFA